MSKIEATLCKVTTITRRKKEGTQAYLKRLMTAAEALGEDGWEELGGTPGAQEWVNAAVEADKGDKDIPDIPGRAEPEPEEAEVKETKDPKAGKKPAPTPAASSKKAVPPAAKARPVGKPDVPGKAGSVAAIIQLLLKDAQMSVADLMVALEKKGYTPTLATVGMTRAHTRQTFRVLKEAGHLKQVKM